MNYLTMIMNYRKYYLKSTEMKQWFANNNSKGI